VFPTELNVALLEGTERGREILTRTPMRRFGQPEELVGTAVLLASDAASFLTGQCIAVDGGYLASGVNS
jgi:NAD(P)-dependent dehydrogenase (short-subunit alcohol dehydrogenase family)